MSKKTTEQFISEVSIIHDNFYDYSKTIYNGNKEKVEIICPKHGSFWQRANAHLGGQGCPKCANENRNVKKTVSQFISEANIIHNNFYDYSEIDYQHDKIKIKIICPIHGEFFQTPNNHLAGHGCPKCGVSKNKKCQPRTTLQFIQEAKKVHSDKYDYSLVDYKTARIKVKIICPIHGEFFQTPDNHINGGNGCPKCKFSGGEKFIEKYLTENNIVFEQQKRFPGLKDKRLLSYDFYIPDRKLLIEYNGKQHYQPVKYYGGTCKLKIQRHHDWLKRKFARENALQLLVIRYNDDILKRLKEVL